MLKELRKEWAFQVRDFDVCMDSDLNYSSFMISKDNPSKFYMLSWGLTLTFMFGGDGRAAIVKS
ncbi:hypothetical protein CY34DRAFT_799587 [Suillus luteus UH-Slu-Lm8-n1]|uniref:Uncharacterized protein n=1 Tax=Suillus luteus UH-Slu-Lm8-n1 TaxID=930992 RepID=A0A0D0AAE7_9AGAM|nr:hypothetical protein CY34DRAFT_799587 [Suillus luteus UH-Slu-Lm8-n1]